MKNIKIIEKIIKYKFSDNSLAEAALTHTSFKNLKNDNKFERLEFLGDRVLGLVISDLLYESYPDEDEGDLAKRFSVLVSGKTLSKICKDINIEKYIKVGPNISFENDSNSSILSDTMESLIGAIFLDSNYKNAKKFISEKWNKYVINPAHKYRCNESCNISNNTASKTYNQRFARTFFC